MVKLEEIKWDKESVSVSPITQKIFSEATQQLLGLSDEDNEVVVSFGVCVEGTEQTDESIKYHYSRFGLPAISDKTVVEQLLEKLRKIVESSHYQTTNNIEVGNND